MDDTFSIAFVCTGNRFRSPLAEAYARRLTRGLPVTVQSFGTLEIGTAPALDEAIELGASCGIDLASHQARALGAEQLDRIDLLLGFDHAHVRSAIVDAGAPRERSFTLRQLVVLLQDVEPLPASDPVARARNAVKQAAESRGSDGDQSSRDEIPDPFGRSWKTYRKTAAEIRELSIALVTGLFGVADERELPPLPAKRDRGRTFLRR